MAQAQAVKAGSVPCGLYLILPDDWTDPDFLRELQGVFRAINASAYEKNSHVIELQPVDEGYDSEKLELIVAMAALCKSQGVNFIIRNDVNLAQRCQADGVIVDAMSRFSAAREVLGEEAIIGLRCGTSRRLAEQALEAGADYVGFADAANNYVDPAIVRWWRCKTSNPCYVEGCFTNDDCAFYVQSGADFIEAGSYVWSHPDGVMKGIVNMTYAIDLALEQNEKEMMQ